MKSSAIVAAILLAGAAVCRAADGPATAAHETILLPPYPGDVPWQEIKRPPGAPRLWAPAGENPNDLQNTFVISLYGGDDGKLDIKTYATGLMQSIHARCESARVIGPRTGTENGFPVAHAEIYCVNAVDSAHDFDAFIKAVRGDSAIWLFVRQFSRPGHATETLSADARKSLDAAQDVARRYLDAVEVCPATGGTGDCAPEKAKPRAAPAKSSK
ncbi:MAG TPA: hypothetical protein VGF56_03380 [Rhizomicrobium sp.]